jgi:hypothetical protein
MAGLSPQKVDEYHVFIASPDDMEQERREIHSFLEQYNRTTAHRWGVRFVVIDAETYATTGIGEPRQLITSQTLDEYRSSLVLVIGVIGQRFGQQTGTEEEFDWALEQYRQTGFPEIKWFFRKIDEFKAPSDIARIAEALTQWEKVLTFRARLARTDLVWPNTFNIRAAHLTYSSSLLSSCWWRKGSNFQDWSVVRSGRCKFRLHSR